MLKVIVSIFLLQQTKQDLPVHCMATDIAGKWIFYVNTISFSE
jgi:hypothetical protein